MNAPVETCPWCGVRTEPSGGPVHRYLESSPGCWALYGELLAREYENPDYMAVHDLTVDAYALQHPGVEGPQTTSSVYVHLSSLFGHFALGLPIGDLLAIRRAVVKMKDVFVWLEPPKDLGRLTVADVLRAESSLEHCELVPVWAECVFESWSSHHEVIADLVHTSERQPGACGFRHDVEPRSAS